MSAGKFLQFFDASRNSCVRRMWLQRTKLGWTDLNKFVSMGVSSFFPSISVTEVCFQFAYVVTEPDWCRDNWHVPAVK